jgi:hypothetical protein
VIIATGQQCEQVFLAQRVGMAWFTHYGLIVNLVIEDYDWNLSGVESGSA